jgi:beta-glucuronidase
MLFPVNNRHRQMRDLNGFWDFAFDENNFGREKGWQNGFFPEERIAVPASWNEQFAESRDNLGPAWYQSRFDLAWGWESENIFLRFNSVAYFAEVWLNGSFLGSHEGGHLPFIFDITEKVQAENNLLVVRVDARPLPNHVPPGALGTKEGVTFGRDAFPDTNYDFFPYGGIQRPVLLYTEPKNPAIKDITVTTTIEGTSGKVHVNVEHSGKILRGTLSRADKIYRAKGERELVFHVPNAHFWSPEAPNLYRLEIGLVNENELVDSYSLNIGIRTVEVTKDTLLLNGKPIVMLGFGRHEDFAVLGKGLSHALIVKDHALMTWIGANSYRTTHYPYSEEQMQLADELGFLIIDETPAVGLYFDNDELGLAKRDELCQQYIRELIARDKNHPSVIMWSVANEPHSREPEASAMFRKHYDLAKSLDSTRPVTLVSYKGVNEASFAFMDVVCLNRYYGWYSEAGRIEDGAKKFEKELDALYAKFGKPVLVTEFGVDTLPGQHAMPPEMFSEEYQVAFLEAYIEIMERKPFVAAQHVWNFADFKTQQAVHRMNAMNYKGVFTRDRRPKMAAHRLRELWKKGS